MNSKRVQRASPHAMPAELRADAHLYDVAVVGTGPVGLAAALDLGRRGHRVVAFNKLDGIAKGSRAICFSKRSLDIFDRLGVCEPMMKKGVQWNVGKVFWKERAEPIYQFDLMPVKDQRRPGFINLQQYYVEQYLVDAIAKLPNVELRWSSEVVGARQEGDHVELAVEASGASYTSRCRYAIACDGHRSRLRELLGLGFEGRGFRDHFLIADVKFDQERPAERWFWFAPPFPGASALLHKQPDRVWRLDFQLGSDVDRDEAIKPENVDPFVRGLLGPDIHYEYEWISLYTFQCRRMERFVHDRVIFAGDAAHVVSPFGARGCNGGLADVDNLAWRLDAVLRGEAPDGILESYDREAQLAADENIRQSTRTTDFLTPRNRGAEALRDGVLGLARTHEFARPYVNSGRLATAVHFGLPPEGDPRVESEKGIAPGSPCLDAPLMVDGEASWLLAHLGDDFSLLGLGLPRRFDEKTPAGLCMIDVSGPKYQDRSGLVAERYDLLPGDAYLIRPDQYVAARWRAKDLDSSAVRSAIDRALSRS